MPVREVVKDECPIPVRIAFELASRDQLTDKSAPRRRKDLGSCWSFLPCHFLAKVLGAPRISSTIGLSLSFVRQMRYARPFFLPSSFSK